MCCFRPCHLMMTGTKLNCQHGDIYVYAGEHLSFQLLQPASVQMLQAVLCTASAGQLHVCYEQEQCFHRNNFHTNVSQPSKHQQWCQNAHLGFVRATGRGRALCLLRLILIVSSQVLTGASLEPAACTLDITLIISDKGIHPVLMLRHYQYLYQVSEFHITHLIPSDR